MGVSMVFILWSKMISRAEVEWSCTVGEGRELLLGGRILLKLFLKNVGRM
jgi:hypothetical protein